MSSRRGRRPYRRPRNTNFHPQHENLTLDQHAQIHQETSSSPSMPQPSSSSHQNSHQFHMNSRLAPRYRGRKPRYLNKSEKEKEKNSNSGLSNDSNCGDENVVKEGESGGCSLTDIPGSEKLMNGKEDCSVGGLGPGSNIGEIEGHIGDSEEGPNNFERLNLSDEADEDEALKRLKELIKSFEEPELSEELLAINQQLQEDELLAMESIYGDNVFILENESGLKCFQVHIHVEVPKGLRISTKFIDDDASGFSYSFQVEYLSPIVLTCLLPKSYPSKCAPYFTITVQWLGSAKISDLCCKLDSIWLEQAGQEVIYQWVEWLHGCTLSHFGFDSEIVLGPYGIRHDEDMRAISGSVSPDIDIPLMKSYNDEQLYQNFCRNIQDCSICLSEFAGSEFTRLPCQHYFCWKCLKLFTDIHITDGMVLKVKCPEAKCDGMIPPSLLKRLLGEQEFERWESLMLQKTLESMTDVIYCPRCETACLEDEDDHAQCSKCYYSFCTLCRDRRHVGAACMTPEMKLMILQERQNSTSLKSEQRRREQEMINEILSVKEIYRFAKQCPSCKMAIARTEGCNKMVCDNCGQYFCYRCNKAISGYDHFRGGSCELFPEEEIQRWEERMNGEQVAAHMVERFGDHVHHCPNCGQPNVKVGNNNHILCWSCQNHYCYLCKKMVRRSSEHYGPRGCKQHTVG